MESVRDVAWQILAKWISRRGRTAEVAPHWGCHESDYAYETELEELRRNPTQALCHIRNIWTGEGCLTPAQRKLLFQYVQIGAETDIGDQPPIPSRAASLAMFAALDTILEHQLTTSPDFVSFCWSKLEAYRWPEINDEYSAALRVSDLPALRLALRRLIARLSERLAHQPGWGDPGHVAQCLALAAEERELEPSFDQLIAPQRSAIWGLAARGHYLTLQEPLRPLRECPVRDYSGMVEHSAGFLLCYIGGEDLSLCLTLGPHPVVYPLSPYPRIAEFRAMLDGMSPGAYWDGHYFLAHTYKHDADSGTRFAFHSQENGIVIDLSEEEWTCLSQLFQQAWQRPEVQRLCQRLREEYGEHGCDLDITPAILPFGETDEDKEKAVKSDLPGQMNTNDTTKLAPHEKRLGEWNPSQRNYLREFLWDLFRSLRDRCPPLRPVVRCLLIGYLLARGIYLWNSVNSPEDDVTTAAVSSSSADRPIPLPLLHGSGSPGQETQRSEPIVEPIPRMAADRNHFCHDDRDSTGSVATPLEFSRAAPDAPPEPPRFWLMGLVLAIPLLLIEALVEGGAVLTQEGIHWAGAKWRQHRRNQYAYKTL